MILLLFVSSFVIDLIVVLLGTAHCVFFTYFPLPLTETSFKVLALFIVNWFFYNDAISVFGILLMVVTIPGMLI